MSTVIEIRPTVTVPAQLQAPEETQRPTHQVRTVPTHQTLAVVCALVCFRPLGVAAVVSAGDVRTRLALGDLAGARKASRRAMLQCCGSMLVTLSFLLVIVACAGSYSTVH